MANGLPSNIYSEGAVSFDSTPYVNYYLQSQAREKAKDEALDKYYNDLGKNINPAGMRTQDTEGFLKKNKEWLDFYQKNKEAIKNPRLDNGSALSEYQARYQDQLAYINQSKNEAGAYKQIVPILSDPNKRRLLPEGIIEKIGQHDLPLTDPTRKPFSISDIDFKAKPFDAKSQQDYLKGITSTLSMDDAVTGVKTDPKTLMHTITTTSSYGDQAREALRNRASGIYKSDPSVKQFVDTELSNPGNYEALNRQFKNAYGTDIKSPEDLFSAWTLNSIQQEQQKQKVQADTFERQKRMEAIRFANDKELWKMKKKAADEGKAALGLWVDDFIDVLDQYAASAEPSYINIPRGMKIQGLPEGTRVEAKQIPMDAVTSEALRKGKNLPEYLYWIPKVGYMPIYLRYKDGEPIKDKDGNIEVDESLSQPINRMQLKLSFSKESQTATQRAAEMKSNEQAESVDYRKKYNY